MKLPSKFVSESYDRAFLSVYSKCFATLIQEESQDKARWQRLVSSLQKHGLLSVNITRTVTLPPFEINGPKGEKILVDLKKPIDFGFDSVRIDMDAELANKQDYLAETSAMLAYLWACKLLPGSEVTNLTLLKMNSAVLLKCLYRLHRGESSGEGVAKFILERNLDALIDEAMSKVSLKFKVSV